MGPPEWFRGLTLTWSILRSYGFQPGKGAEIAASASTLDVLLLWPPRRRVHPLAAVFVEPMPFEVNSPVDRLAAPGAHGDRPGFVDAQGVQDVQQDDEDMQGPRGAPGGPDNVDGHHAPLVWRDLCDRCVPQDPVMGLVMHW